MQSCRMGWPTSLRACALEFPDDPTAWYLDRQFMVGESILAAPVFTEAGDVEFYLPAGKWTSFWDGTTVQGPGWRRETHGFNSLPLYVREGTVLALGKESDAEGEGFGYDWLEGGEVRLYCVKEGDKATMVDKEGEEIGVLVVGKDGGIEGTEEALKGDWGFWRISEL